MNCMQKRGFLTLSTCDAEAMRPCTACGLMTCVEHLSPASGLSQCVSCANADQTAPEKTSTDEHAADWDGDSDWSYRRRSSYYSDNDYSPSSSFDRHDSRAFQSAAVAGGLAAADDADDDDGHPGFGDS